MWLDYISCPRRCIYQRLKPFYTAATFTSNEDKIRLCYLAALSCGLLGVNCKSAIPQHLAEMVIDLETFEQHPWGYEAVTDLFSMVCRMMWRI